MKKVIIEIFNNEDTEQEFEYVINNILAYMDADCSVQYTYKVID